MYIGPIFAIIILHAFTKEGHTMTPSGKHVIRGSFIPENSQETRDLQTKQMLNRLEAFAASENLQGVLEAAHALLRINGALKRDLCTIVFKHIKSALHSKRVEIREWHQLVDVNRNRPAMIEFPQLTIDCIQNDVDEFCTQIVELLDMYLIPSEKDHMLKCSLLGLRADYLRYMAEFTGSARCRRPVATRSLQAYIDAEDYCRNTAGLGDTSEVILGILLNRSVLEYEILNDKQAASSTCLRAIEKAHAPPTGLARLFNASQELNAAAICVLQSITRNSEAWDLVISKDNTEDDWIVCDFEDQTWLRQK